MCGLDHVTPCHLHVKPTVPTTEIQILVNKRMTHFIEQQSEKKKKNLRKNQTNLHSFVCVDSAALQQVNVERLIDGPQRGGILLYKGVRGEERSFLFLLKLNLKSRKTVAAISCRAKTMCTFKIK